MFLLWPTKEAGDSLSHLHIPGVFKFLLKPNLLLAPFTFLMGRGSYTRAPDAKINLLL